MSHNRSRHSYHDEERDRRHRSRSRSQEARRKRARSRSMSQEDRRRRRGGSEEDRRGRRGGSEEEDDYCKDSSGYNYEKHKRKLNKIFFRSEDFVKEGTPEFKDFWKFLAKYQAMEKKKKEKEGGRDRGRRWDDEVSDTLGIPLKSDLRHTINFRLKPSDVKELLNRIPYQDRDDEGRVLSEGMVAQFQLILSTYINFLQKEKFSKLRKLREAQANLPIAEYREQIVDAVREHQVLIVAGDTGCGKSTQVPQFLLDAGMTNIACTQPRRIACIALANRVSYETLNQHGTEIGYQIRFEKSKSQRTKVVFLTEGLLLRQVTSDPGLGSYDVIVLDEVHERHLHGDFLLGLMKCLIQQRKDLRVILMSATINIKLFSNYFNGEAPVIQVPGRLFPISMQYHPVPSVEQGDRLNPAPYIRVLQMIDAKYPATERGDLLVFLSGISEITRVSEAATDYAEQNGRWVVLQLHSTLSLAEQDKVFDYAPEGIRKVIISTNIAETSVTIDGVRFVCDSGKVKEMAYDPITKMRRLKEFWVSRASAEQRKGRAGRTGPGTCFRLFSEQEYQAMAAYSKPEIERVPLDSLVLQMVAMGLPDCRKFPFIEPPKPEALENSISVLKEQEAMTEDETLTVTGKVLSNLPVDVSIGKMLIMGTLFHQADAVLSLAAALSVQSPFTNKAYKDMDCVANRRNLDSDHGDPITLLNSYREWLKIKNDDRENSRKWCKRRGLEEQRFYEMTKLRRQFEELLEEAGLLGKRGDAGLTSSERMARHGEMRQLKEMKRNIKKTERKKKTLKVGEEQDGDEKEDDAMDMKDIDFKMRNDAGTVRQLLNSSSAMSYKDLSMLKLILSSGLYPQYGVGDEHNSYKGGTDQLFHTKVKPFNVLHPNSIFASQPEVLQLDRLSVVAAPGFTTKHPASSGHQVLVYLSLLETIKPYMMESLRMPALPALLLFSHTLDCSADFGVIVCDAWLELRFVAATDAQDQVVAAVRLRRWWQQLLDMKLTDTTAQVRDDSRHKAEQAELETRLSRGLVEFVHNKTVFSMKRLLPADLKVLYVGPNRNVNMVDINPFEGGEEPKAHPRKGGLRLSPNVTYNCLKVTLDKEGLLPPPSLEPSLFLCPVCQTELYCGPLVRMGHLASCRGKEEEAAVAEAAREAVEKLENANPLARRHHCPTCATTLLLTSSEILRHRRNCGVKKEAGD